MEKAFHLAQWIFLDLFCCSTALKSKFRLDQHRYQLTGTSLMCSTYSAIRFQNCCIGRTATHIQNSKRKFCSRSCHGSKGCHNSFYTGNNCSDVKVLFQPLCDLLHWKMRSFDHCCNTNRFFHAGFSGKCTGNFYRGKCVNSKNICDPHIVILRFCDIRHTCPDTRQHISYICIGLTIDIPDFSGFCQSVHDLVSASIYIYG